MKTDKLKRIFKALIPMVVLFGILVWPASEYNKSNAQIPMTDAAANASLGQVNMNLISGNLVSNEMAGVQSDMAAVQSETAAMTEAMKNKQEAMEKADKVVGYVQDIKALKQVTQSFASLICTYQQLSGMLNKNGSLQICHINAHYSLAIIDIQGAVDLVKLVVKGGLKMDQGIRISNLKQAIDLLNRGHAKMMTLSSAMSTSQSKANNRARYVKSLQSTSAIYKY